MAHGENSVGAQWRRTTGEPARPRAALYMNQWAYNTVAVLSVYWACPLSPPRVPSFSNRVGMNIPPSGLALDPEGVDG